jgi:hypothetical protein
MILFYSEYCPHCRTILEEMKRRNVQNRVKMASIDKMKAMNYAIPSMITNVPALYLSDTKQVLFGKNVFDHFFLPGRGILLQSGGSVSAVGGGSKGGNTHSKSGVVSDALQNGEPTPFSLGGGLSEGFGLIESDSLDPNPFSDYGWGVIQEESPQEVKQEIKMASEETRTKKESLDLDGFKANRDAELSKLFNAPNPALVMNR